MQQDHLRKAKTSPDESVRDQVADSGQDDRRCTRSGLCYQLGHTKQYKAEKSKDVTGAIVNQKKPESLGRRRSETATTDWSPDFPSEPHRLATSAVF